MLGLVSAWVRWDVGKEWGVTSSCSPSRSRFGDWDHQLVLIYAVRRSLSECLADFLGIKNRHINTTPTPDKAYGRKYSQTRHFTNPLPNSRSHVHDANLVERIPVEPLVHELARVLETEVESGWVHGSVHHGAREVEDDEVTDCFRG